MSSYAICGKCHRWMMEMPDGVFVHTLSRSVCCGCTYCRGKELSPKELHMSHGTCANCGRMVIEVHRGVWAHAASMSRNCMSRDYEKPAPKNLPVAMVLGKGADTPIRRFIRWLLAFPLLPWNWAK